MPTNKELNINGPINAIRLEGKIGNTKKVIYLFGDWHEDACIQTECEDFRAKEFKKYLVDNFDSLKGTKKMVDFFFEIHPTNLVQPEIITYKGKYIRNIFYFFQKNFKIEKNKVSVSKEFPNIRFHYGDIRDYLMADHFEIINSLLDFSRNIYSTIKIFQSDIDKIRNGLEIVTGRLLTIFDLLYKGKEKIKSNIPTVPTNIKHMSEYTDKDLLDVTTKLIYKILENYKHEDVKQSINFVINNELKLLFEKYLTSATNLHQMLKDTYNKIGIKHHDLNLKNMDYPVYGLLQEDAIKYTSAIHEKLFETANYYLAIFTFIMDIYLLRRVLDKDYVNNGVIYTGIAHSSNYLYFLVKYCDFKITNYSYLAHSIDKSTQIIKNSKSNFNVRYMIYPPTLYQCSNLTEFPKNFE